MPTRIRKILAVLASVIILISVYFTLRTNDYHKPEGIMDSLHSSQAVTAYLQEHPKYTLDDVNQGRSTFSGVRYESDVFALYGVDYDLIYQYEATGTGEGVLTVQATQEQTQTQTDVTCLATLPFPLLSQHHEAMPMPNDQPWDQVTVSLSLPADATLVSKDVFLQSNAPFFTDALLKTLFIALVSLLLLWVCTHAHTQNKRTKTLVMMGTCCLFSVFAGLPLLCTGLAETQDLFFHLSRIQGVAMNLREGVFPMQMNPFPYHQYGYPDPVYYPYFFLLFPACLKLLSVSTLLSYKALLFACTFATASIASFVGFKLFSSRKTGLVMGALWVFGTYRLTNIYVRGALGEVLATTFLPLAFYGLHSVLVDKKHKAWLALALGMSGILCSHVLSVLLTSFCLLLYALFHFAALCKKDTWIALIKAVLLTLGLCAFWLVPFLGWSSYEISGAGGGNLVQKSAHLSQMFHQFVFSMQGLESLLVDGTQNEMPLSIGFWPLIGAIFYGFVRFDLCKDWFHQNKHLKQLGDFGLFAFGFFVFAASSLFPYPLLLRFPLLNQIRAVQFPWRLLTYASFFGTLLTTISVHCLLKGQKPKVASTLAIALVLLTIFGCMPLFETLVSIDETNYKTASSTLSMDADVLYVSPVGAQNRYTPKPPYFACEDSTVTLGIPERDLLTVTVRFENPTGASQFLLAPQYHYPSSYAVFNDETPLAVEQAITGCTAVVLPEGLLEGTITVGFVSFDYYRLGYGASLIALALLLVLAFQKRPKRVLDK